jgi:HTH-type transcriptional regulator/antitoxin HigA
MASKRAFRPDWATAPGDTIADLLRERGLSVAEFARRMGYAAEDMHDLLQGRSAISIAVARQLEQVLGSSVEFWMSRDFQYREDAERLREEWIAELPVQDMVTFGWLEPVADPSERLAACLRFFDVPTVEAWRQAYATLREMVAFRMSQALDSRPAAVAAWLRKGEIQSETIPCHPWNPNRFEESLLHIRSLTRQKDPKRFLPELQKLCAASGVAVAVVRPPAGCRASGATRFLSRDRALLMLSFRYLTDDQFWFTFFHEAGHLLLHGESGFFLEGALTASTTEEEEANDFAARALIPSAFQDALLRLPVDAREVVRFAVRAGVSPGVVVGQLQHLKRIRYNQLNRLKRRFTWEE